MLKIKKKFLFFATAIIFAIIVLSPQVSAASVLNGTLCSDQPSTVPVGTNVTLTGQGIDGDGNYSYYFGYSDGSTWHVIPHNPQSSNAQWTPTKEGTYYFAVDIFDGSGSKTTEWMTISVVNSSFEGRFYSNQSSSVPVGTNITLTGQGIGGSGNYSYYYGYSDGSTWHVLPHDPKTNTVQWRPTVAGTYYFAVDIFDGSGSKVTQWMTINAFDCALDGTFSSDQSSTISAGTNVTLMAQGSGGDGNYSYYYGYSDGSTWHVLPNDPKTNTVQWRPTTAGTYYFAVDIFDGRGSKVTRWLAISVYVSPVNGTVNLDQQSPVAAGTIITMTAQATGGSGDYTYYFGYSDGSAWHVLPHNPQNNSLQWKPTKAGTYYFAADIFDSIGTKTTQWFTINAYVPPLDGVFYSDQQAVVVGTNITLTTLGTGGDKDYSYYFGYSDGSVWHVLPNNPKNGNINWMPDQAGTYYFAVDIFDGFGSKATKWISINAVGPSKGIDVSVHQNDINWQEVRNSGISFAMIRDGFGKDLYLDDAKTISQKDSNFEANYLGATAAGLKVGAYHFSYAMSVAEAQQEANLCLSFLNGKKFDLPIAYDVEDDPSSSIKLSSLSTKELTDNIIAFCETIKAAGYRPALYINPNFLKNEIDYDRVKQYDLWIANWDTDKPCIDYPYAMWQYTSNGNVSGISGRVDMDYAYRVY